MSILSEDSVYVDRGRLYGVRSAFGFECEMLTLAAEVFESFVTLDVIVTLLNRVRAVRTFGVIRDHEIEDAFFWGCHDVVNPRDT